MNFRHRIRSRVAGSRPMQEIIRHSRRFYMPGLGNFSFYDIWPSFRKQLQKTSVSERAAAISFNVFMAIPPTLVFVFTLVPYLPISERFIAEIFHLIRDVVPGEKDNSVIIGFLDDFLTRPRNELLSFGLVLALFFSSNAMMGVLRTFDKNYSGFVRSSGFWKRMAALQLTLIVFLLVFSCLFLLIAQDFVLEWLGVENKTLISVISNLRWLFLVLLVFFTVAFIYRHGPFMTRRWPLITPGSVIATSLMILSTVLVTYWVEHFSNYNKLYGSISAIFILMGLIYVNSLVLLFGFELNVTLSELRDVRDKERMKGIL